MRSILTSPFRACAALIGLAMLFLAGLGAPTSATAQSQPTVRISAASVIEGNVGTRVMRFFITLDTPSTGRVSGRFITKQKTFDNQATQGTSCTGESDFLAVDEPFEIPAGSPSTSVDVLICGDTRPEPGVRESVRAALSILFGAQCPLNSCSGSGFILEDDVPGFLSTDNVSVSRSAFGFNTFATIPVRLSLPSGVTTTVDFSTRNGTAQGGAVCSDNFFGPAYQTTSGRVTFLPGEQTATIRIVVCKSGQAPELNFSVGLFNPTAGARFGNNNTSTVTLLAAVANLPTQPPIAIGVFGFSPDDASIKVDEPVDSALEWTMPPGQVWRDLANIGLRVRSDKKTLLWINWNESSNLFSLCQRRGLRVGAYQFYGQGSEMGLDDDEAADRQTLAVTCSAGALPGSDTVLETPFARLHLEHTRVQGSGPAGSSVMLHMRLSFKSAARGQAVVELAASDDSGRVDNFERAAELKIVRQQDD